MSEDYCPDRGDVVWISFSLQSGAVFCPITTQAKGYSFEVKIPVGYKVNGAVLSDHVKSLDWRGRRSRSYCELPDSVVVDVIKQIGALLGAD